MRVLLTGGSGFIAAHGKLPVLLISHLMDAAAHIKQSSTISLNTAIRS